MAIRFFDMFAGIGGFRSGLASVGGFECVGYCEIDKYPRMAYEALYDTEGELYFEDARTIDPDTLPDIDLITGGFPCQSFSMAGKRRGFDDARGTLFFEIARIAEAKRPSYLLLENVPGLLSHDRGRTFASILDALSELGYDVAWQVLNSKDFGVPQDRKRVYIVGYLRDRCAGEILSFDEAGGADLIPVIPGKQGSRVYSDRGASCTLTSAGGGGGAKTGLYEISLPIKVKTKAGYQLAEPGDSIDLAYPNQNSRRGRVGKKIAHTVTPGCTQGYFDLLEERPRAFYGADRVTVRVKGSRMKAPEAPMYTLTAQDRHGIFRLGMIRRLTPLECWRLQGFTDEQFKKAKDTGLSDQRLYKMAGNAVSVPVIAALGKMLKDFHERNFGSEENEENCGCAPDSSLTKQEGGDPDEDTGELGGK